MTDSQMLTLEQWRSIIEPTENLSTVTVPFDGTGGLTVFSLPSGWNIGLKDKDDTDLTEAKMRVGDDEYSMTKQSVLGVAQVIGIPASYVFKTPGPMIQSHLNYWASHSTDVVLKFLSRLTKDGPEVLALTKDGITPFSNMDLLNTALSVIGDAYDTDDLKVDYKSHHDLKVTSLRLVIPGAQVTIGDVTWLAGVQIRNSLTGKTPLSVQGYLFSEEDTNGVTTLHAEGKYNRKIMGQNLHEVMEWVAEAVGEVLSAVPHEFESIGHLTEESIEDGTAKILADVFKTYKVPLKVRNPIMDSLLEGEDFTYYGLVNAISQSANTPGLPEHFVTAILEIAGDVMHSAAARCVSCKRVTT